MNLNLNQRSLFDCKLIARNQIDWKKNVDAYHCILEALSEIFECIFDLITRFCGFKIFRTSSVTLFYALEFESKWKC